MKTLHLHLHGFPQAPRLGDELELDGIRVRPILLPAGCGPPLLPVSFESAFRALEKLPGLFCEPDGSFTWISRPDSGTEFHFDGLLHDTGTAPACMELNGRGPLEPFDALLTACGWPERPLLFQLVRAGIYLDEAHFRRWADLRPAY